VIQTSCCSFKCVNFSLLCKYFARAEKPYFSVNLLLHPRLQHNNPRRIAEIPQHSATIIAEKKTFSSCNIIVSFISYTDKFIKQIATLMDMVKYITNAPARPVSHSVSWKKVYEKHSITQIMYATARTSEMWIFFSVGLAPLSLIFPPDFFLRSFVA
jgi:hypothetical protein